MCSEIAFDIAATASGTCSSPVRRVRVGSGPGHCGDQAPASAEVPQFDHGASALISAAGATRKAKLLRRTINRISIDTRYDALHLRRKVARLWPRARDADRMSGEWVYAPPLRCLQA